MPPLPVKFRGAHPSLPAADLSASLSVRLVIGHPFDAKDGGRRLEVMRWGLIPYWAKDIKISFLTMNARAEEVDTKPAFRSTAIGPAAGGNAAGR